MMRTPHEQRAITHSSFMELFDYLRRQYIQYETSPTEAEDQALWGMFAKEHPVPILYIADRFDKITKLAESYEFELPHLPSPDILDFTKNPFHKNNGSFFLRLMHIEHLERTEFVAMAARIDQIKDKATEKISTVILNSPHEVYRILMSAAYADFESEIAKDKPKKTMTSRLKSLFNADKQVIHYGRVTNIEDVPLSQKRTLIIAEVEVSKDGRHAKKNLLLNRNYPETIQIRDMIAFSNPTLYMKDGCIFQAEHISVLLPAEIRKFLIQVAPNLPNMPRDLQQTHDRHEHIAFGMVTDTNHDTGCVTFKTCDGRITSAHMSKGSRAFLTSGDIFMSVPENTSKKGYELNEDKTYIFKENLESLLRRHFVPTDYIRRTASHDDGFADTQPL